MNKEMKINSKPYREEVLKWKPEPTAGGELARIREQAFHRFQELGFPTRQHEAWKYIYLDSILNTVYTPASASGIETDQGSLPSSVRISSLESGFEKLPHVYQNWLKNRIAVEENVFSLINEFQNKEGLLVFYSKNMILERSLQFSLTVPEPSGSEPFIFYPRICFVLEEGVKAEVILNHSSFTQHPYFMNAMVDIYLAEGAELRLSSIQHGIADTSAFMKIAATLQKKSRFEMISFTQGGLTSRQETQVDFRGSEASCHLKNLSVLRGVSRFYQHATANHYAGECQSNQLFKTILAGEAQSEVNSLVHVVRDAQKSESRQLNRNLILSDKARIYSRPQLKIYADDVKCSHGAATGQLDDSELFYLRSRGISKEQARLMMTLAFAEEVIQLIEPKTLRDEIEKIVKKELEGIVKH